MRRPTAGPALGPVAPKCCCRCVSSAENPASVDSGAPHCERRDPRGQMRRADTAPLGGRRPNHDRHRHSIGTGRAETAGTGLRHSKTIPHRAALFSTTQNALRQHTANCGGLIHAECISQTALRPQPATSPHASALTRTETRLGPAPWVIAGCAHEP